MSKLTDFTNRDLELFPDPIDGTRYELINGELLVSKLPRWEHQHATVVIASALITWSRQTRAGIAVAAPGIIISDVDEVAPDIIWVSHTRLAQIYEPDGKLHGAPELICEILSPGIEHDRRDRKLKLQFYSLIGVEEYWIADWQTCSVEVYRRDESGLRLASTLSRDDVLTSPLLPGFAQPLRELREPEE